MTDGIERELHGLDAERPLSPSLYDRLETALVEDAASRAGEVVPASDAIDAALFDGLWQRPADRAAVEAIIEQLDATANTADLQRREETAATRVNFFTMVRGDD